MPSYATGTVTAVLSERMGFQSVTVDGRAAYVLTDLIGPVAVGDRVVVNTTAVERALGTGGFDVVHWNLSRESWSRAGPGHVMKLRYTSLQADTGAAEESLSGGGEGAVLDLVPIVVCDLHSQVAVVAAAFAACAAAPGLRLVYVMTDSAALPLALSDTVAGLLGAGLLAATVTSGQAFGGEHEAVNLHSALVLARSVGGADAVVVGPGPGTVGTGSRLGFGSLSDVVMVSAATSRLGGNAVVALRYSGADPRDRHRGVSHHSRTALELCPGPVWVPYPRGEPAPEVAGGRHHLVEVDVPDFDSEVASMGRGRADDPGFFTWTAAAGVLAAQLVDT